MNTKSRDHFVTGSIGGNAPKLNTALRHKNDVLESSAKKKSDTINHIDFPQISCVNMDNQPMPPNKTNSRNMHVIKERSAH